MNRTLPAVALGAALLLSPALAAPAQAATPTDVIAVNPFTASGEIADGWSVTDRDTVISCDAGDQPSGSALVPGTHHCGPTVFGANNCYADPLHADTLLCTGYGWTKKLTRFTATGLTDTPKPGDPFPFTLELTDGSRWVAHYGGGWPRTNPGTWPAYGCVEKCSDGDRSTMIIAPDTRDIGAALDKSTATWTVQLSQAWGEGQKPKPVSTMAVAKAWFLGGPASAPKPSADAKPKPAAPTDGKTTTKPANGRGVEAKTGVEGDPTPALLLTALAAGGVGVLARRKH